jgi:hypothetical protein
LSASNVIRNWIDDDRERREKPFEVAQMNNVSKWSAVWKVATDESAAVGRREPLTM